MASPVAFAGHASAASPPAILPRGTQALDQDMQQQQEQQQHPEQQQDQQQQQQQQQWTAQQQHFMTLALQQARAALKVREVPIGCVVVRDGDVIGTGYNMTNHTRNATRHAEFEAIDAILAAHGGDVARARFTSCQLYVTIEPCIMCAGALSLLGFSEVIYGAANDKFGGCGSILSVHQGSCGSCSGSSGGHHGQPFPARGGLFAEEAIQLLQLFYLAGNPLAPKPKRKVLEVPPWEQEEAAQDQDQHQQQQQPNEQASGREGQHKQQLAQCAGQSL